MWTRSPAYHRPFPSTRNHQPQPRSTVGTVTEIYDYLRLLYARVGVPHCPVCGRVISQQTVDEMVDAVLKLDERYKVSDVGPGGASAQRHPAEELDAPAAPAMPA